MNSKAKEHRNALTLCILALISGILFVWFSSHPGLWGDALGYYKAALRMHNVLFVQNDPNLSVFLIRSPWLVVPLTLCATVFMPLGETVFLHAFFLFQVVFYAINLLLIYAVTYELTGHKKFSAGAMLAGLLYTPFLFYTDHLLRETMHTTFLLAFAWCFLRQKDRWGSLFLFLALTSNYFAASAQAAALLVMATVTYGLYCLLLKQKPDKHFIKRIGFYSITFAIGYIQLTLLFGFIKYQALENVTLAQFADSEGWGVIAPFHGEISVRTAANVIQLPGFFNALAPTWQNTLKWILYAPGQFITTYTTNLYRFFAHPSNVYHRTWILPSSALLFYHQLAITLFALGLPLVFNNRRLWLFYFFPLVWALAFSIIHIEDRYNVIIMPFILIAATYGVYSLWRLPAIKRQTVPLLLFLLVLILWLHGTFYPVFIDFGLSPSVYYLLGVLAGALGFGVVYTRILSVQKETLRLSPAMLSFLGIVIIFMPPLTVLAQGPVQLEQKITLKDKATAKKIIPLKKSFFTAPGLQTYLLMDVMPYAPDCLTLLVNGRKLTIPDIAPPPGLAMQRYMAGNGLLLPTSFRQYMFIPLPEATVSNLARTGEANITISNHCHKPLALYSDYPAGNNLYWIPSPHWGEYSIYKAIYDRDGRIPRLVEAGKGSQSLVNGKKQPFQFRIMLFRLVPGEGRRWGYPLAEFRVDESGRLFKLYELAY